MNKFYMVVRFKVRDYAQFKRMFDKVHSDYCAKYSLGDTWINRNADDANELIIVTKVEDLAKAREFAESFDLKAAMKEAGATDKASIWFLEELAEVRSLAEAGMYDAELG